MYVLYTYLHTSGGGGIFRENKRRIQRENGNMVEEIENNARSMTLMVCWQYLPTRGNRKGHTTTHSLYWLAIHEMRFNKFIAHLQVLGFEVKCVIIRLGDFLRPLIISLKRNEYSCKCSYEASTSKSEAKNGLKNMLRNTRKLLLWYVSKRSSAKIKMAKMRNVIKKRAYDYRGNCETIESAQIKILRNTLTILKYSSPHDSVSWRWSIKVQESSFCFFERYYGQLEALLIICNANLVWHLFLLIAILCRFKHSWAQVSTTVRNFTLYCTVCLWCTSNVKVGYTGTCA